MNSSSRVFRQYGPYRTTEMLDGTADTALYHAMHIETGRVVLLRVLSIRRPPDEQTQEQVIARCMGEIAELKTLTHEFLLSIIDYGFAGTSVYIAYPVVNGLSLARYLYGEESVHLEGSAPLVGLPSLGQVNTLLQQIGAALQVVHDAGHIHGQLEPRSIFIQDSTACVADTGMLRLYKIIFRLDTTSSFSMTRYSAPEVWEAERYVPATDQYALACLAYELVTGTAPFESTTIIGLMNAHLSDTVYPPHKLRPDLNLPAELSYVFWQALAKPMEERFRSVMDFVDAFDLIVRGREGTPTDFFTLPYS